MVRISSHPSLILAAQQHLDQKQQSTELREGEEGTLHTLHPASLCTFCFCCHSSPEMSSCLSNHSGSPSPWGSLCAAAPTAGTHRAQSSFCGLLVTLGVALPLLQPW